ncbi:hypothetical protein YC2023_021505 [Brassica napus]
MELFLMVRFINSFQNGTPSKRALGREAIESPTFLKKRKQLSMDDFVTSVSKNRVRPSFIFSPRHEDRDSRISRMSFPSGAFPGDSSTL